MTAVLVACGSSKSAAEPQPASGSADDSQVAGESIDPQRVANRNVAFDQYFEEIKPDAAPAKPDDKGFIRRWTIIEPINKPNSGNTVFTDSYIQTELTKEYFPGQFSADINSLPKAGDQVIVESEAPRAGGRGGFGGRGAAQAAPAAPATIKDTLTWHSVDSKLFNIKLIRFATGLTNGQKRYGLIFNAFTVINCEQDMVVRLAAGSNASSIWWVNGEKVTASPEAQGNARRVVDVTDPDNFCIEVISRDQPEGSSIDNWDTQFFVTMPEAVNEGDTMYFEARVRAEKAASSETQAHTAPTAYKHWAFVGNIPFTTEWATYTNQLVVASNQAGCNTIAVNLAVFKEANKYYFDDIKIVVKKAKPVENWETLCEYAGDDATGFSVKYFKNYTDAAKVVDGAIVVESLDPEKTYTEYNNGDAEAKVSVDWDTQFLIPLPKKLAAGTKAKITMKIKADKEIKQVDSQAHGTIPAAGAIEGVDGYAGTYLHYDLFGKVDFLTDWGTFEKEFTVPEQGNDMQSICFNLEKLREINKYYFKEIKVEVSK